MEIHHADKAYRKRALWLLAGIVLMCGVLLWQLHAWLDQLTVQLGSHDPDTVRAWVRLLLCALGVALAIPAIGLGLTLRQMGYLARLEGRFPPAQWKTLRDVRVLRDAAGLAWAKRIEAAGVAALALAGLLIGWSIWAWWRFGA
ncbi:hypothetical protein J2X04_000919 [Lysobacter niabensis]|jgi:hypothetical protein|uniref:Uncharacterized protein n=1 Tax=Agrilutibacter niabensis TaxID=380628 RepID=A0ABU1VM75_9GAMM|nr:hypothetical protein [Lysobacter niabensis]MDR7098572.1 hypothetical protein [Lysobacter niabensis]